VNIRKLSAQKSEILRKIAFIISICFFLFSSIMLIGRALDSYKAKALNRKLSDVYEEITSTQSINSKFVSVTESENSQDKLQMDAENKNDAIAVGRNLEEENKFPQLKKINSDIKGWINIESTQISNPVVQTVDNSFYLDHDVTKNKSDYGTIFIDLGNDVSSPEKLQGQNIILYGHHMKDGSMFGTLKKFRAADFFKGNEFIKLDFFPNSYIYQIFGVYLVHQDFDYRNTKLGTKEDIESLLNRLQDKRLQYRDVTLTPGDTILTLSTCEYDFKDARLVLMAKLLKDGAKDIKGTNQKNKFLLSK
jgi:sortase B